MRSNILVHWTGRDLWIDDPDKLTDDCRTAFLARLQSILTSGFWMTMPEEKLCRGTKSGSFDARAYKTPMTCFTEVRLTQASTHARCYGLLGIGVTRPWVLDRMGGPVHYVRNTPREFLVSNHFWLLDWIEKLPDATAEKQDAINYFAMLMAYLKGMSDVGGGDTFARLEEHEWRVVFLHGVESQQAKSTGHENPPYLLPVDAADISCIVFPDCRTRRMALREHPVADLLAQTDCPLLAGEDIAHF